jgi:plasmid stability protein
MIKLTIRNVDPALKERLRLRAARNGRSMEAAGARKVWRETASRHRNSRPPADAGTRLKQCAYRSPPLTR